MSLKKKNRRELLFQVLKLCKNLKTIYAKFQGNRLLNELAQTLKSL